MLNINDIKLEKINALWNLPPDTIKPVTKLMINTAKRIKGKSKGSMLTAQSI
jgi:hypothetical protein